MPSNSDHLDPAMAAAWRSLPLDLQQAVLDRRPEGERALRAAYLTERAHRNPYPNRAARRAAARRRGATR